MTIQATQVLNLLSKATKLSIPYTVYEYEETNEYTIRFDFTWYSDEYSKYSYATVIITKDNESNGEFYTFMSMLDEKLEEEERKRIKAQKRQELIDSLTPEQRELLNL